MSLPEYKPIDLWKEISFYDGMVILHQRQFQWARQRQDWERMLICENYERDYQEKKTRLANELNLGGRIRT